LKHQQSIILASASPRRKQLMAEAGYSFDTITPDVDESSFSSDSVKPCKYAEKLALAKAKSIADKHPDTLVIGADTIVDFDGLIIGKPDNKKHAEEIIRKLFSRPHKVITAVALVKIADKIELVESDTTTVYPKKMTEVKLKEHIKSNLWQGKAGAYAIQENDDFVEKINGSFTNVMGMPMELLQRMLKEVNQ